MSRSLRISLLCLVLMGCGEPPPVASNILEQVTTERATVSLGSRSAEVVIARVPAGFYDNTASPEMGRTFAKEEFSGASTVCMISRALWEVFGSGESDAPLIVGATSLKVIGVMPDGFDIPAGAQVWIPK